MGYQLSFTQIWTNFDKLAEGLLLSLWLAFISILIGAVIGLVLAVCLGRSRRADPHLGLC